MALTGKCGISLHCLLRQQTVYIAIYTIIFYWSIFKRRPRPYIFGKFEKTLPAMCMYTKVKYWSFKALCLVSSKSYWLCLSLLYTHACMHTSMHPHTHSQVLMYLDCIKSFPIFFSENRLWWSDGNAHHLLWLKWESILIFYIFLRALAWEMILNYFNLSIETWFLYYLIDSQSWDVLW